MVSIDPLRGGVVMSDGYPEILAAENALLAMSARALWLQERAEVKLRVEVGQKLRMATICTRCCFLAMGGDDHNGLQPSDVGPISACHSRAVFPVEA
jgi:hypothetical protein